MENQLIRMSVSVQHSRGKAQWRPMAEVASLRWGSQSIQIPSIALALWLSPVDSCQAWRETRFNFQVQVVTVQFDYFFSWSNQCRSIPKFGAPKKTGPCAAAQLALLPARAWQIEHWDHTDDILRRMLPLTVTRLSEFVARYHVRNPLCRWHWALPEQIHI
jgi:hypothetical protein